MILNRKNLSTKFFCYGIRRLHFAPQPLNVPFRNIMTGGDTPYTQWSPEQLVDRILALEQQLGKLASPHVQVTESARSQARDIDPSKYSTRFIALKFAYLGQDYNGLEYSANNPTPLPTIEEMLWKALMKARLIFPQNTDNKEGVNWQGCEYSKCGRTDRGVSAFGQVIGIRIRSNRPLTKEETEIEDRPLDNNPEGTTIGSFDHDPETKLLAQGSSLSASESAELGFDDIHDEIPYCQVLNRLLPPDIRVLAWCPNPPEGFSARFSCRERQYRYFFTQPAFMPTPGPIGQQFDKAEHHSTGHTRREGWLNIEAMNIAAKKYEGLHDFRNLCKVDASKQIVDFRRRIFLSEIREVPPEGQAAAFVSNTDFSDATGVTLGERNHSDTHGLTPRTYMFILHGSAFLWHQVRHMVAILFLIGQGLETPEVVDELMDIKAYPGKPLYDMADDAPLVLWDCIFPQEASESRTDGLDWVYPDHPPPTDRHLTSTKARQRSSRSGDDVNCSWELWHRSKMGEILAGSLLNLIVEQRTSVKASSEVKKKINQKIYQGGDSARTAGRYIPILQRRKMDCVEVINRRFLERKDMLKSNVATTSSWRMDRRGDHVPNNEDIA